jgi:hypothetical protein
MKLLKHVLGQPFIFATGLAALIHSTWSLGTFFSGPQPSEPIQLLMWITPALLIAFSLDVGQIVTSAEIRAGHRSRAKYLTFGVFAAATYFLQFAYISAHMPAVNLAAGIRSDWLGIVTFIRDSGVFILPGLLPLSTLLYTFSQEHETAGELSQGQMASSSTALVPLQSLDAERVTVMEPIEIECDQCEWAGVYSTPLAARNALTAHRKKHASIMVGSKGK